MPLTRRNFLLAATGLSLIPHGFGSQTIQKINLSSPNSTHPSSKSVDLSLLLHCIAQVETGNNDLKIGPKGERSRYQISEKVWYQHWPTRPFYRCRGDAAMYTAVDHICWLDRNLTYGVWDTFKTYPLAWCWHGGLESWTDYNSNRKSMSLNTRNTVRLCNYATRVCNLYDDARRGS